MKKEIKEELKFLNQSVKELSSIHHNLAKNNNISDCEYYILYTLTVLNEDITQKDISSIWFLPKQTVNSSVVSLIKKNYLVLKNMDGSNMKKVIELTKEGQKFCEENINNVIQAEEKAFYSISENERKTCLNAVKKYLDVVKESLYDNNQK